MATEIRSVRQQCTLYDIGVSQGVKATCFSYLSGGDQAGLIEALLMTATSTNAAGFKVLSRGYSDGKKPMELHLLAIGEREPNTPIDMPKFGVKGCPYHTQLTDGNGPVQAIVTLSKNVLVVSSECTPHLLDCRREDVMAAFLKADEVIAGGNPNETTEWSGSILSQIGMTGGQTVAHTHLHVTRGITPG